MFEPKQWIIACVDCNKKLNLGEDAVRNLVDYQGKIIKEGARALNELVSCCAKIGVSFPRLESIKRFVEDHPEHPLRLAPITDGEFEGFITVAENITILPLVLKLRCDSCAQSSAIEPRLWQEYEIKERAMSVQEVEWYHQILELYNLLGCTIKRHKQALGLESLLPFVKLHAGHKVFYKASSE